jgi:hypothetical protein
MIPHPTTVQTVRELYRTELLTTVERERRVNPASISAPKTALPTAKRLVVMLIAAARALKSAVLTPVSAMP